MTDLNSIFSNIRVIELASVLAGPSVGQFLAELGAEVIKIENPKTGGDVTRSWKVKGEDTGDRTAYFSSINWGKKSVLLDITEPDDLEKLYKLVASADMVVASYKPGDDKKLKVDYETLRQLNPKLVYGQVTGYGALKDRVGYDAIIQAEAGFMHMNGEATGPPTKMPVALMDLLAGHQLKEAMLLGYINLLKTGEGSHFTVSLIESGLASLANQATNYLIGGNEPQRKGSKHPNIAPYGEVFTTKDQKQVILAVGNNKQFNALLKAFGLESQPKFETNQLRVEHREELYELLASGFNSLLANDLMEKFNAAQIPAGIVNKVSDAISEFGGNMILQDKSGLHGLRTFISNSEKLINSSHILPPPKLGEHTEEVLKSI